MFLPPHFNLRLSLPKQRMYKKVQKVIAETSMWPDSGLVKFFYVCIPVCLRWHSRGCRNYPICLKLEINVYVLRKISCIVFGVHCLNSTSNSLKISFDMVTTHKNQ